MNNLNKEKHMIIKKEKAVLNDSSDCDSECDSDSDSSQNKETNNISFNKDININNNNILSNNNNILSNNNNYLTDILSINDKPINNNNNNNNNPKISKSNPIKIYTESPINNSNDNTILTYKDNKNDYISNSNKELALKYLYDNINNIINYNNKTSINSNDNSNSISNVFNSLISSNIDLDEYLDRVFYYDIYSEMINQNTGNTEYTNNNKTIISIIVNSNVLLNRLLSNSNIILNSNNCFSIIFICYYLSCIYLIDDKIENELYALIGGFEIEDFNIIFLNAITLLDYDIHVTTSDYFFIYNKIFN